MMAMILKVRTDEMKLDSDYIDFFKFTVPSLQEITIRKEVANFWNDYKNIKFDTDTFDHLVKEISQKVSKLHICESSKQQMINVIRPIGAQLILLDDQDCNCIVWTLEGTIDQVLTYNNLIRNAPISLLKNDFENCDLKYFMRLFEKACQCCLEEQIFKLWFEYPSLLISMLYTKYYYKKIDFSNYIIIYWISILRNETSQFVERMKRDFSDYIDIISDDVNKNMFLMASGRCDIQIAKYFWFKLSYEDKNDNILQCILTMMMINCSIIYFRNLDFYPQNYANQPEIELLFFFLSQLNNESQRYMFQKCPKIILSGMFQSWPHRTKFLPKIKTMLETIDVEKVYIHLVSKMLSLLKRDKNFYANALEDLWYISPFKVRLDFLKIKNFYEVLNIEDQTKFTQAFEIMAAQDDFMKMLIISYLNGNQ